MKRPKRVPRWRRKKKILLYRPRKNRGRRRTASPVAAAVATYFKPSDFDGNDNHPPTPPPKIAGKATYQGQVVFTNVNRRVVEELLPKNTPLKLATNNANSGLHPIIHLQGHQTDTAWIIGGPPQPVGRDYAEFILLIPFVQIGADTQWYNYVPRIYLTDPGAWLLGNLYFFYRKEMAGILVFEKDFDVNLVDYPTFTAETAFQCHRTSVGGWLDDAAATTGLANYSEMKTIMNMPILGVEPLIQKERLASYFSLDFAKAQIAAFDCNHEYFDRFTPDGLEGQSLVSVQNGAFSVKNLDWRLSYPATTV